MSATGDTVLIHTIHRVEPWFAEIGRHMGYARSATVADIRGEGDYCLAGTFYRRYRSWRRRNGDGATPAFDEAERADIIARCRLLRWLPPAQATAMVLAMADACEEVLDAVRPAALVGFPIDRYVSDVLARLGERRGVPFHELTASAVPNMAMVLHRGQLLEAPVEPDPVLIEQTVHELADPLFTPTYVQNQKPFDTRRWLRVFAYFQVRGWFFRAWGVARRDPLSSHYMDARNSLGHKPRLGDRAVCGLVDRDWREKMAVFPEKRRLFIGLQLFPEASIDYWVQRRELIDYDDVTCDVARAFSQAGYCILVKDHPLQFGFRQRELIDRLRAIPNVLFVPYEVSGNEVLAACAANFTLTGTLGMQAALMGKASIVAPCYYTNAEDFVLLEGRADIGGLPAQVDAADASDLDARRRRIIAKLLRGSFPADFFSFRGFDPANPSAATVALGRSLGGFLRSLAPGKTPR